MHPKKLNNSIEVKAINRPIKIAYIVPHEESQVNHNIIDAVFYESYTRWAGAFTLIIPSTTSQFLIPNYENWLKFFDPDFVYIYGNIEDNLIKKIDELCSPIELLQHKMRAHQSNGIRWRDYLSNWNSLFSSISSIATVASPYAQYGTLLNKKESDEIYIVTKHGEANEYRFLSDNYGTAFDVHMVTHAIPGLFQTISLVPSDLPRHIMAGTKRCTSIVNILSEIGNRSALPIARFAMVHSEFIPKVKNYEWSNSFNIFVGNTILDRIHFWNSRSLNPSYSIPFGSMIIDPKYFQDLEFIKELGNYLNRNNYIRRSNGPAFVNIRSCSLSESEAGLLRDKLKSQTHNSVSIQKFDSPAVPSEKDVKNSYYMKSIDQFSFKLIEDRNKITAKKPEFINYIPHSRKDIAKGQWVVELEIERHNNLSKFSNVVDCWLLPRRRKITKSFTNNMGKITINNRLALLPASDTFPIINRSGAEKYTYDLLLPSDEVFFKHLVLNFFKFPKDDLRASITEDSYKELSLSDKGQNLRGVISLFDSLSSAYSILTNKYWRNVLRSANENSVRYLEFDRNKLNGFLPNDRAATELLMRRLRLNDIGETRRYLKSSLTDTLEYLVRAKVFYKVHNWRCNYCGHMNYRSFDSMKIKNLCEICSSEYFAPIDLKWTYQLNDFVHRSLIRHNGLSVLWAIGFLQDRPGIDSFWYMPEVDLYEDDNLKEKNEIDVLCIIDGKFHAIEVKNSVSLLVNKPNEIENFIRKINLIKPDVAMLIFERYCSPKKDGDIRDMKSSLAKAIETIKEGFTPKIELKTIIAQDEKAYKDFPDDLGVFGKRTDKIFFL